MTEIFGDMSGDVPEPQGLITCDLGEFIAGPMSGDVPEPQGLITGTVSSGGDRTEFVTIQDAALAGFKYITKGPGFLIAGAAEFAKKVFLIDATGFRSLRIESESIELDGEIGALVSSTSYIFAYVLDQHVLKRRLYVLENASGLAVVAIFDIDDGELSTWLAIKEDGGLVALPIGVGRVQVRSIISPFAIIGEVEGIGRSAVAVWSDTSEVTKIRPPAPPVGAPSDFASLWDLSAYTTPIQDSWQLPAYILPDTGPANLALTITNRASDGIAESRVVRIEHTKSAPDGIGVWAVDQPQQLVGDTAEYWYGESTGPIDFNADGAWALGGWFKANNISDTSGVLMSQSAAFNGDVQLQCVVTKNAFPILHTVHFELRTTFATSGVETIVTAEFTHNEWHYIWFQQDGITCEIYVDGIIAASSSPVGATGINISNGNPFRMWGGFSSGGSIDMAGGLGRFWHRYTRLLTPTEVLATRDGATNYDFLLNETLVDVADAGQQTSVNTTSASVGYGADRKTFDSGTASGSPITLSAWLMCTPIFETSPPVEMQFRCNGFTNGHIGLSAQFYGGSHYLTNFAVELAIYPTGHVVLDDVLENSAPLTVINDGDIITWRISPPSAFGGLVGHYYVLINNVAYFDKDLPVNWWTALADATRFALGTAGVMGSDTIDVLSTPAEMVYPLGVGFTFQRSI